MKSPALRRAFLSVQQLSCELAVTARIRAVRKSKHPIERFLAKSVI